MVKILLVDTHEIVRKGIRRLIESEPDFSVVGEAGDGVEALRMVERKRPEVIVLELMLKGVGGLELIQQLNNRSTESRVVVLSAYSNEVYVTEALRAGARAYVLKDSAVEELLDAIRRVADGRCFLCASLSQQAFDAYLRGNNHNGNNHNGNNGEDPYEMLSSRERQILHLIVQEEMSSALIAERLLISRRTVESHRANIMRKLGLNSYSSLVRYAVQKGILPAAGNGGEKVSDFGSVPQGSYVTLAR